MTQPVFDKQDQLERIQAGLISGETVIAVYDAVGIGTGFIGLTNKRAIIQDNSFFGKKMALTSVLYDKITSVSFLSDKSAFGKFYSSSSIAVSVGTRDYTMDFRGEQKGGHVHEIILWHQLNG